ncbi:MAG: glycosyltransferase family 4 protein [Candidatus Micrarchaeota archaeon]|nr:glycosyltransferase family 4 protein [Candidatus Micrarchaeota archaeon]
MEIIIIQPFLFERGGVEKAVLEIAKKFNPIIYSVVYNPTTTFEDFKDFDIRILPKHLLEKPFFFLRGDLRRYAAVSAGLRCFFSTIKEDYDVINAHATPSEWIRNQNSRVVWFCHSPNREAFDLYNFRMSQLSFEKKLVNAGLIQIFKSVEMTIVPKIEKIVTNSEFTKQKIKKYLKREDAEVVHPGVDPNEFENEGYSKYFLYPSRITPAKRMEFAINAFRTFSKLKKDWRLVIAGFLSQKDLFYLDKLKNISAGLNVEFRPNPTDEELKALYANCYAVLFSAINEDWGLVPLEAMASEKPCISVNEGGPTYSILDGKTGFLINSENEMATKMLLLANNLSLVERMGKLGRSHVIKHYTWKNFLKRMNLIFKEVANK